MQAELRMLHGDGSTVWVRVNSTVITDRRGRPMHIFAQLLDTTAAHDAQAQETQRAARQTALAEIGRLALEGMSPVQLAEAIVATAADQLDAQLAAVLASGEDPSSLRTIAAGDADELWSPTPRPPTRGLWRRSHWSRTARSR
jgi:hypothetical protein